MTAGHFGLATGLKKWAPRLPLWALLLSTYLLDIIFIIMLAFGLENFQSIDPAHPAYGAVLIHAYYTHSLLGAALIALVAGWFASRRWGQRNGVMIAAVVFSHWLLDLLVHRPDLPILPGNLGNLPLLGFGLWQLPVVSAGLEFVLILGGVFFYYRSASQLPTPPNSTPQQQRRRVLTASTVTAVFLFLLLITDLFGL